jgi:dienelactone hydrolase
MEWSIRGLLNPVITRLLIYGVNPIDVEYVVSKVENINYLNIRSLENAWTSEWQKKAGHYTKIAEDALMEGSHLTASELFMQAAYCYYAVFLINQASIEDKKRFYERYAYSYNKSISSANSTQIKRVDIPLKNGKKLAGYLHLPSSECVKKKICTVIFSGLGSCKEEMHTLARPLLDRGVFVFIPDMPGNGESLFSRDITCNIQLLEETFNAIPAELDTIDELAGCRYGVYGLCMGGGYAFRAASINKRYTFCVTLFGLLITKTEKNSVPQWMKQGEWARFQMGNIPSEQFLQEMEQLEQGTLDCPYLFIHGKHDNWMTLDSAYEHFHSRAQGSIKEMVIDTEPVFSTQQLVTHTMPVGEQLHWIRHIAADWIIAHGK